MPIPLRILIVEDRPADAELMMAELQRAGFAPTWDRVDTEADYLARLRERYDVILCDYKLPQFDALRALYLMQVQGLDLPFIIVSGTIGEDVAVHALQQGADDYLLKDRLARLGLAITHAMDQKHLRDQQRRALAALQESEARFRAIFEKSAVGIARMDAAGRHVESNRALQQWLGYSADELSRLTLEQYTHPEDAPGDKAIYTAVAEGRRDSYRMAKRYLCRDGQVRWGYLTITLIRDARGAPLHLIGMVQDITERKFAEEELSALNEALEQRVAERTRELRDRNEELHVDLRMAGEIQRAFLPQQHPSFPQTSSPEASAFRFAHRYRPAGPVGGDLYDVLAISDTTAGIFLCDVTGHDTRAALVTAMLHTLVQDLGPSRAAPEEVLNTLNRVLGPIFQKAGAQMFATAVYLLADAGRGRLRYSCAGHPCPLLLSRARGTVTDLTAAGSCGPALGWLPDTQYHCGECALAPGDVVLAFTDGLFEISDASQNEFGRDRLRAAVQQRLALPIEQLLGELMEEARRFSDLGRFTDDVCLVACEVQRLLSPT